MMWTEKLKAMGSRTLSGDSGGDCEVNKRVVVTDVSNVKVREGMAETMSEPPIKVISSDIRTLRDGVRATLLFGSQCAVSICLRYPIPVGHCQ